MSCVGKLGGFDNHLLYRDHAVWENNQNSPENEENARSQLYSTFKYGSTGLLPSLFLSTLNFFP